MFGKLHDVSNIDFPDVSRKTFQVCGLKVATHLCDKNDNNTFAIIDEIYLITHGSFGGYVKWGEEAHRKYNK